MLGCWPVAGSRLAGDHGAGAKFFLIALLGPPLVDSTSVAVVAGQAYRRYISAFNRIQNCSLSLAIPVCRSLDVARFCGVDLGKTCAGSSVRLTSCSIPENSLRVIPSHPSLSTIANSLPFTDIPDAGESWFTVTSIKSLAHADGCGHLSREVKL